MIIDTLQWLVKASRIAFVEGYGWQTGGERIRQVGTQEYSFDCVAAMHGRSGPVRRLVIGCNAAIAAYVASNPAVPGDDGPLPPGDRERAAAGFRTLCDRLQEAMSGDSGCDPDDLQIHVHDARRFRACASGARNFEIEIPTPLGHVHLLVDLSRVDSLDWSQLAEPEPDDTDAPPSKPSGRSSIETQAAVAATLSRLAATQQDVQLKISAKGTKFSLCHATVMGLVDSGGIETLALSSTHFDMIHFDLDADATVGVVFFDDDRLLEFESQVVGLSYRLVAESARLQLLNLSLPRRISPGQRRSTARIVPSHRIKGWIRCTHATDKATASGSGASLPVQVRDLSSHGAQIAVKNSFLLSQFKQGSGVTCRLELPAPFGGVRVKGIIQRLELDSGPNDSVTVHMGIEFIEGAQPFNIGLAKVRNYLAILKRQERVPAQV